MGCGQSALKKEIEGLQALETKRAEEIAKLEDERRMLKYKMSVLEDMVATAQLEAQEKIAAAAAAEERMKVLKWELVRQAATTPRQSLTWALNDKTTQKLTKAVSTRQATILPSKEQVKEDAKGHVPSNKASDVSIPQRQEPTSQPAATARSSSTKASVASTPKNPNVTAEAANESTKPAEESAQAKKAELLRVNTPRKVVDPSEVNESKEAFEAAKSITASSSRRTKDSNAIERGNSNLGTRRHSSKSIIRGTPIVSARSRDSMDDKSLTQTLQQPQARRDMGSSSAKPKLSPQSSRSSIIVSNPSSRETSPTAAASKGTSSFVLTMPLSKGGSDDLPPRKHSKTSPPRPDAKSRGEPEAEPSTGVTAFALDDDDDDDGGGAVVCLDESTLDDLM